MTGNINCFRIANSGGDTAKHRFLRCAAIHPWHLIGGTGAPYPRFLNVHLAHSELPSVPAEYVELPR